VEFAAQIRQLDASAAVLRDQSADLSEFVSTFIVERDGDTTLPRMDARTPALTALASA
jgi:hypothetical protein